MLRMSKAFTDARDYAEERILALLTLGSPVPRPKAAFGDRRGTVRVADQVERCTAGYLRLVGGLGLSPLASNGPSRRAVDP